MSNRILAVAIMSGLLLVCAGSAFATGTRLNSMGAAGAYFVGEFPVFVTGNLAIEDEANIFQLPATLTKYGNRVMIDELQGTFDTFGGARFGIHYSISDYTVLAVYGSNVDAGVGLGAPFGAPYQPTSPFLAGGQTTAAAAAGVGNPAGDASGGNPDLTADYKGSIMFAHDIGGFRFGAGIHIFGDSAKVEAPNEAIQDIGVLVMDFDLGVGFDFMGDNSLDFGIGIKFGTFDYILPPQEKEYYGPETNFAIDLTGRGILNFFQGTQIIPYGQILYEVQGLTDTDPPPGQQGQFGDYSHFGLELGVDLKIEPFERVYIYPGFGFRLDTWKVAALGGNEPEIDRRLALPYYGFGLDARIWDWFVFRMGARQYVLFDKEGTFVSGGTETDTRDAKVITTFDTGFSLIFGENDNWIIDAHLQPEFFLNGPSIISGNATTDGVGHMNIDVALKYTW